MVPVARTGDLLRRHRLGTQLLIVLALAFPPSALAQERAGAWYFQAGLAAAHEDGPSTETSVTYLTAPGGTTWGWLAAAGIFVGSHVSVEGEWSGTGLMHAREPSRYGMTFDEERRQVFLTGNVRVHLRPGTEFDIEPVAGAGVVWHGGSSQTEYYRPWLPPGQQVEEGPQIEYDALATVCLVLGADLRVGGTRFAIVPSFRARASASSDELTSRYPGGTPRWSFAGGVSVRAGF
jgi:hypothetical protein